MVISKAVNKTEVREIAFLRIQETERPTEISKLSSQHSLDVLLIRGRDVRLPKN